MNALLEKPAAPSPATSEQDWIRLASAVCQAAARGDLEGRILNITADGELGELLHGINALLDMTDAFVREATASLEFASQGKFFRRVLLAGMLNTFERAARSINAATHSMDLQAKALREAEQRRARLAGEFDGALSAMKALETASSEIGSVVKVIRDVASQTNLLAVNATIEAARVGEAGRGFAVVAEQVQNLAGQTSGATSGIGKLITGIQAATKDAVAAIDRIRLTVQNDGRSTS